MPMTLSGDGTITGLAAGGLPDATVTTAEIVDAAVTAAKMSGAQSGSAPIYGARAWVNFNGTGTVAIRASGNVSSITDNGTGDYTLNFTTEMSDANYSALACMQESGGNFSSVATIKNSGTSSPTSSAVRFSTFGWTAGNAGAVFDPPIVNVSIFR